VKKNYLVKNALWGLFISDAICMPAHWYYKLEYLKKDFGKIKGYNNAPLLHPESFMVGNDYFPDVKNAQRLDRPYDILHHHKQFYNTSYSHLDIPTKVHSGEHANLMPSLDERYHYHYGLKAGENTLGANLVRVLMRSVIKNKGYNQESFLNDFVEYMSSSETNNDPYLEIYIRDWFEKYSKGTAPELCAQNQKQRWSIGSHGGIIRPLVLALTAKNSYEALGISIEHQHLTHKSEAVSSALSILVPMLFDLLNTDEPLKVLYDYSKNISLIKIHGKELSQIYHDSGGPGNISKEKMWKIHTEFSDRSLSDILPSATDEKMITARFSTACYPEHGLPLIFYFLYKNGFGFASSIYANANAGGDNVHRGMILGLLAGAVSKNISVSLKKGLIEYETIKKEIEQFAKYCDTE